MKIHGMSWLILGLIVGTTTLVIAQAENPDNLMIGGAGPHYIRRGQLGIGKTNPSQALDVNGNAIISGKLTVSGNVVAGAGCEASLTEDVTPASTTIRVNSTSCFPSPGTLYVGQEAIIYMSKTATTFENLLRGRYGTITGTLQKFAPIYHYPVIFGVDSSKRPLFAVSSDSSNGRVKVSVGAIPVTGSADLEIVNPGQPVLELRSQNSDGSVNGFLRVASSGAGTNIYTHGAPVFLSASTSGALSGHGFIKISSEGVSIGKASLTPDYLSHSSLEVGPDGYLQFSKTSAGLPPVSDCDSDTKRGRLSIDTASNRLYVCNGLTRGWDYIPLTN